MPVMGFNPAMEMSMIRSSQGGAIAPGQQAAAVTGSSATGAAPVAAQATLAAAAPGAAGEAAMGAAAVQPEPPQSSKIVLASVLRGASTGASVALGFKQFGPILGKLPMIGGLFGGIGGFLTKLPVVGSLLGRTGISGFLIAGGIGAAIGAGVGLVMGMRKARAATTEYAEAQAAAQQAAAQQAAAEAQAAATQAQSPVPDQAGPAPGEAEAKKNPPMTPGAADASTGVKRAPGKSPWVTARTGKTMAPKGERPTTTAVRVRSGDTLTSLATRYHTTVAAIVKANPAITDPDVIRTGQMVEIPRSMRRAS